LTVEPHRVARAGRGVPPARTAPAAERAAQVRKAAARVHGVVAPVRKAGALERTVAPVRRAAERARVAARERLARQRVARAAVQAAASTKTRIKPKVTAAAHVVSTARRGEKAACGSCRSLFSSQRSAWREHEGAEHTLKFKCYGRKPSP
jgi:hypothetical protein